MLDRKMLYSLIYALAACAGRESVLFGTSAPNAREAFSRSLAGNEFPELWFELPLLGEPWFDLHVLASRTGMESVESFLPQTTGGNPGVFEWFASQGDAVRQLALSWDTGSGDASMPAVQLLVQRDEPEVACDFLKHAGREDAAGSYRAFLNRLPSDWFACYTGVFAERLGHNLRVECIPTRVLQEAYGRDENLLEKHLRQVGLADLGTTLVSRCHQLAGMPFRLEFQFDVDADGSAGDTFGASLRFECPPGNELCKPFDPDGDAGEFMRCVEEWGLADDRWRLLADTAFAKRARLCDESATLYCYPAFVKLRWRAGEPLDAKAYLIAGIR